MGTWDDGDWVNIIPMLGTSFVTPTLQPWPKKCTDENWNSVLRVRQVRWLMAFRTLITHHYHQYIETLFIYKQLNNLQVSYRSICWGWTFQMITHRMWTQLLCFIIFYVETSSNVAILSPSLTIPAFFFGITQISKYPRGNENDTSSLV